MRKYSFFYPNRLTLSLRFFGLVIAALLLVLIVSQSLYAQEATSQSTQPTAVITSPGLNVRSGPGFNFVVIGYVREGDSLEIVGQAENCRWLLVRTPKWGDGWISGKVTYTTINVPCDIITAPAKSTPSQPTQQVANSDKVSSPTSVATLTITATPAPTSTPTIVTSVNDTLAHPPAGEGCYLLQNRLGPQLTVTFTNQQSGKSVQIIVPHGAEIAHCMVAGKYTYTISAVGYKDENGEMKVIAGDAYMLPIGAQ